MIAVLPWAEIKAAEARAARSIGEIARPLRLRPRDGPPGPRRRSAAELRAARLLGDCLHCCRGAFQRTSVPSPASSRNSTFARHARRSRRLGPHCPGVVVTCKRPD